MAKKKQSSVGDVATGVTVSGDIKALIHDHSLFFDRIVELIPAKFYLPTDDKEKVWFQGLSKSAKAKAKKKTVENTKKARRNRLDPEKSSKTTLDLLKESLEKEKSRNESSDDDDEENGDITAPSKAVGADGATYEELRQKLRRKIEELRSGRGGSEIDIERRAEKEEKRKRKREEWFEKKRKEDKDGKFEKEVSAAAEGIEFGKVKLGDDDWETDKKRNPKKRKLSKEEELERARKLVEAKKDPEKGKAVTWQAATSRAMGVKVHDNPRLLKERIQREKRKHKKSVEKWKDRVKNTENMKKEKQDKRKGNIQSNIDKKKQKKIERREKKLMKRPGFEGRKDGYVNGQK